MKKRTMALLLATLIGSMAVFTGCGAKKEASVETVQEEATKETVEAEPKFAEKVSSENPLSDDVQAQWDSLDTDCSKINWKTVYSAPNSEGIVVSETYFNSIESGKYHLVVAFTNLTGAAAKMSFEGYAEDVKGNVVADLLESDVEIGPENTLVREYTCDYEELSGEIDWKNFTVEASDKEYVPVEYEVELVLKSDYIIEATRITDDVLFTDTEHAYGCVIDKDGNILIGGTDRFGVDAVEFTGIDSFEGKNEDVLYFPNLCLYK